MIFPVSRLLTLAITFPGFAHPELLWGLGLAAVPWLIERFFKPPFQEEPWAAVEILRAALQRESKKLRIRAWLMMAVRTLLLMALVLGAAGPRFETNDFGPTGNIPTMNIIAIDCSYSMGAKVGPEGTRPFDQAITIARQIVESSNARDRFCLVSWGAKPVGLITQPTPDRAALLQELDQLNLTEERGSPWHALAEVAAIAETYPVSERKRLFVLTDFHADNWEPDNAAQTALTEQTVKRLSSLARVALIDLGTAGAANVGVTHLRTLESWSSPGRSCHIVATLRNFGTNSDGEVRKVSFKVDGTVQQTKTVEISAESEVNVEFLFVPEAAGDRGVEVSLTPGNAKADAETIPPLLLAPTRSKGRPLVPAYRATSSADTISVDDQRWLVVPVHERWRVLLVDGRSSESPLKQATTFVRLALDPWQAGQQKETTANHDGSPFQWKTTADTDLSVVDLSQFDCVVLCDVPQLNPAQAKRLEQFVVAGGGLVIGLGEQVRPESYNSLLYREGRGPLPAKLLAPMAKEIDEESFAFAPTEELPPLLQPFQGNRDAGLATTRIQNYFNCQLAEESPTRIDLALSNGDPVLLDREFGDGRVVLLTTSLDDRWGTWVVWPSFVPMIHEAVRFASSSPPSQKACFVGETMQRRLPGRFFDVTVTQTLPDSSAVALPVRPYEGACELTLDRLSSSGLHTLQFSPPLNRRERLAVNVDPRESRPEKVGARAITQVLFAGLETVLRSNWQPTADSPPTSLDIPPSEEFSLPFFHLAAALLLLEILLFAVRRRR